ncbi:MAG: hypothetical protein QM495_11715 [Lutibacter sp.]|uniref:hypothetical protein n=1 Tax=Lutibacter sp. TaxID=1925666 RepID=UPI00385945B0
MRVLFLLIFLFFSTSIFSQEIGSVKNGNYTIKLLKSNNLFSFVYSDITCGNFTTEKSFNFPNKETIYSFIMSGFEAENDHQMILQTSIDTIVKFEFKKIKGRKMLQIRQNNLVNKTFGSSTFFTKDEIHQLFGNP